MTALHERHPAARTAYDSVGEALGAPPRRASAPPRTRRQNALLTLVATLLGLWFGLAAPAVSPVDPGAPPAATPAVVSEAAGPVGQAAPADPVVPADPEPADPRAAQAGGFGRVGQQGRHR